MSEIVARTGWPWSPKTSQNTTGQPSHFGSSTFSIASRSFIFGEAAPGEEIPEKSPFTSAMKTGTPMRENFSASTCSVTVLPVPVAPATRPWRFARPGSRQRSVGPALATSIGSSIAGSWWRVKL